MRYLRKAYGVKAFQWNGETDAESIPGWFCDILSDEEVDTWIDDTDKNDVVILSDDAEDVHIGDYVVFVDTEVREYGSYEVFTKEQFFASHEEIKWENRDKNKPLRFQEYPFPRVG